MKKNSEKLSKSLRENLKRRKQAVKKTPEKDINLKSKKDLQKSLNSVENNA